jgi:endonuclease G, mitochondrial
MKLLGLILSIILLITGCSNLLKGNVHLKFGNPSNASRNDLNNYLLEKPQYALSYNCSSGIPNWVSWQLNGEWLGEVDRSNDFRSDLDLPSNCYVVRPNDYRGSGYDKGHMSPSADRSNTSENNSATFLMTNMIPQSPANNREVWRELEEYCRNLVKSGKELYIIAGGEGKQTAIGRGKVTVPLYTWKVVLILDRSGASPTDTTEAIAVNIPNRDDIERTNWKMYRVSIDEIEKNTGYDFFSKLPNKIQSKIEAKV